MSKSKIKPHVWRSACYPGLWAACLAVHEPARLRPNDGRVLRPCTGVAGTVGVGVTPLAAVVAAKKLRAVKYKLERKPHVGSA